MFLKDVCELHARYGIAYARLRGTSVDGSEPGCVTEKPAIRGRLSETPPPQRNAQTL